MPNIHLCTEINIWYQNYLDIVARHCFTPLGIFPKTPKYVQTKNYIKNRVNIHTNDCKYKKR